MRDAVRPEQDVGGDRERAAARAEARPVVPGMFGDDQRVATWRDRVAHPAAVCVAAIAHMLLLAAVLPKRSGLAGGGGDQLESIAVSIVADVPVALGAQVAVAPLEPGEAVEAPDETPAPEAPLTPFVAAAPQPADLSPEPVAAIPEAPVPALPESEPLAPPAPLPAAMAAAPPPQAAAPASAGVVQEYARQVAATLAKSKPKGAGFTGTLKLRFIVDETGRAGAVTVVATSGMQALDEIAVKALTRSEFPPPPAVLPPGQRTFEVPYSFR